MLRRNSHKCGRWVLALGMVGLAGCQQLNHTSSRLSHTQARPAARLALTPVLREERDGTPITPSQTADLQVALGRAMESRGEPDKAMEAYRAAMKQNPHLADAYQRMAILHDRQGHVRDSESLYKKALEARPDDAEIYCDRGYSCYLQRRWAEAEANLRQAIVLKPDHPRAHNNLGLVLGHMGRTEAALLEFQKGGCSAAEAHANLAFALAMEQRWPEARRHYERALALNPSSEPARKGLRDLNVLIAKVGPAPRSAAPDDAAVLPAGLQVPSSSANPTPASSRLQTSPRR